MENSFITHAYDLWEQGPRPYQEDALWPFSEDGHGKSAASVFIVCDGVGSSAKGRDFARQLATEAGSRIGSRIEQGTAIDLKFITKTLTDILPQLPEAGASTFAMFALDGRGAHIAWIGDSRVYQLRPGAENILCYQTTDHSLVAQLIQNGQLSAEEVASHPQRSVLLRAVQHGETQLRPDYHFIPWRNIQTGDHFLICSDGVWDCADTELTSIFQQQTGADAMAEIARLCRISARDNYSAWLLQVQQPSFSLWQRIGNWLSD